MKYKRLAKEELVELENEFINFLSSAQITAPDWEKMKKNEVEKAEELLDVFSDAVYEKVMSRIRYLEYRDKNTLTIYYCSDDKIYLVGLRVKETHELDFTLPDVLTQWNESNMNAVSVIKTEKEYVVDRGVAVFELIQSGCLITNERLFNTINNM